MHHAMWVNHTEIRCEKAPKGHRSARFDPGTPAKFTLGALLEPLDGF
jgi:hypothetical protein